MATGHRAGHQSCLDWGLGSTVPGYMRRAALEIRLWCPVPEE